MIAPLGVGKHEHASGHLMIGIKDRIDDIWDVGRLDQACLGSNALAHRTNSGFGTGSAALASVGTRSD